MKASVEKRGKPSHRANLRQELLDAGKKLLVRDGHEALSMQKLAEEVGVSSAAPFYHFPDRRSLLVALALEGYRDMYAESRTDASNDNPRATLRSVLRNFLRFASTNRRLFALMYESELIREPLDPAIAEVQNKGYESMSELMAKAIPSCPERERAVRTLTIWSAVFGFALQSNHAMIRQPELAADELADAIVHQALRLFDA